MKIIRDLMKCKYFSFIMVPTLLLCSSIIWGASIPDDFVQINKAIDLGDVPSGSIVKFYVPVENKTKNAVRLTYKSSDCGCTSAQPALLLQPKEKNKLMLSLETKMGKVEQARKVLYKINGVDVIEDIIIKINAKSAGDFIDNRIVDFGSLKPNETKKCRINLLPLPEWDLKSFKFKKEDKNTLAAQKFIKYVDITFTAPEIGGRFKEEFVIYFKNKNDFDAEIAGVITGSVGNPAFLEDELFMGIAKKGQDKIIEKSWPLKNNSIDINSLSIDAIENCYYGLSELEKPEETIKHYLQIKIPIPEDWDIGMHDLKLSYFERDALNEKKIKFVMPVRILLLP